MAAGPPSLDGARRSEILQIASGLFAASGYTRTSLKDVADACGILPGSLYHHFDSKQAIATELLERYYTELDEIGSRWANDPPPGPDAPTSDRVVALGIAIAECAVRHGAALHLAAYEPHAGASPDLMGLARRKPEAVTAAMQRILDDAAARGDLVERVDPTLLTHQLVETMLHVGLGRLHKDGSPARTATLLCSMVLYGVAKRPPADRALNRSAAMGAASATIAQWSATRDDDFDERRAGLRAVARAEFARRGYEATTIRDIAAAAGMGTGTVYRLVEGKEALLASIMNAFYTRLSSGYEAVAAAPATAIEKLDALTWLNVNARERFSEEFEIQQAWFRSYPPETNTLSDSLKERTLIIRDIVAAGFDGDEIRTAHIPGQDVSLDDVTPCVRDLIWVPPSVVGRTTTRGVFTHARATVLRGALAPAAR
ncbi:transcriptional regulator, TetR family [Cryptosporangium aurantiacum]|uniref:Transcriptional regulator, TetR family n=1 Tax=Cryptosporangium aurantiacum TaxID=134849 RepID=A0A1M7KGJ1_9ACTN|nr:transcriptional regulator, TetR family [Cryptosporangium aurantiacum]